MTDATCGLRGFLSSLSNTLQSSLVSRLRRRLDGVGSTLFSLTWRAKATPAGRPYFQLAASALRTSDNDAGSWGTPTAQDTKHASFSDGQQARDPNVLSNQGYLASWPTRQSRDGANSRSGQPERTGGQRRNLDDYVTLASWATPTHRDYRHANARSFQDRSNSTKGEQTEQPSRAPWADLDWLPCTDGKARPVEPGTFPLAHGIPGRVGRLRAYGNAVVPQVAAEFIAAYRECRP